MNATPARFADIVIAAVLIGLGLLVIYIQGKPLDAAAASTLAGALFGGAAILAGNWLNRRNDAARDASRLEDQIRRVKMVILAEMGNVTAGLVATEMNVRAAIDARNAGLGFAFDVDLHAPREMPYTFALTADEFKALNEGQIVALSILRSNLGVLRQRIYSSKLAIAAPTALPIPEVLKGVHESIRAMADCFARIDPTREMRIKDGPVENAVTLLRRIAKPAPT